MKNLLSRSTIKASHLCIGNTVIAADEQEADFVIAVEIGVVHLSRRSAPDDERNIFGHLLTNEVLQQLGFKKSNATIWQHATLSLTLYEVKKGNHHTLTVSLFDSTSAFYKPLSYTHELQNVVHAFTGKEIFLNDTIYELLQ